MSRVLAIDLGASSGRAILGEVVNQKVHYQEISRFDDYVLKDGDQLTWDIDKLMSEIFSAIKKADVDYGFDSLAVATWGVDFGLLDKHGQLIRNPVHYRDPRTKGMVEKASLLMELDSLYKETGIQIMEINTLFQLLQLKENEPEIYEQTDKFLLMPDLINYLLTGEIYAEKSIASTTQLFDPKTMDWHQKLIDKFNFKTIMFPKVLSSGQLVSTLKNSLANDLSVDRKKVMSIASHDTASAIFSVPSELEEDALFLSSGTWSLFGKELNEPILNEKAKAYNFSNEVGAEDTITFLSNLTGMWLLEESKRYYKEQEQQDLSYTEITQLANEAIDLNCYLDVDDARFGEVCDMPKVIQEYARNTKQDIPSTPSEIFRVIYKSLALKYKQKEQEISDCIGYNNQKLYVIGGGSQAAILNQMIADAFGFDVYAGPAEATAIGNILLQLIGLGEVKDMKEARKIVRNSEKITHYPPQNQEEWQEKYKQYEIHLNNETNGGRK